MVRSTVTHQELAYVFGLDNHEELSTEAVRHSNRQFVRSQDHLALDRPNAKGRKLCALEALETFGLDKLREVIDYGSAILPVSQVEPALTLKRRRLSLGLDVEDVAKNTGLSVEEVNNSENESSSSSIHTLEKIATALGLDERLLSIQPGAGGDEQLAVRLKTLGNGTQGLSSSAVLVLSEAAWVIRTQTRLQRLIGNDTPPLPTFHPNNNYGGPGYPVWEQGYYLARKTRELLGLTDQEPVPSMRSFCRQWNIPLLFATLPDHIAGATISSQGQRGIVVNTQGHNTNVWVFRATIAHELGHILWDSEPQLKQVVVDEYQILDTFKQHLHDVVEARANAFAIAFLAPLAQVELEYNKHAHPGHGLRAVMEKFGLSYMAAKHHIYNAVHQNIDLDGLIVHDTNPTDDWRGREAYTDDFFPLRRTSQLRKGDFAGVVVAAQQQGFISLDTACAYLQTTPTEYQTHADTLRDLFSMEE